MGGSARRIINICQVLKALSPGDGAFTVYRRKLLGELQRLALSLGLDEEREDGFSEADHPREENGRFAPKEGSGESSESDKSFLEEVGKRKFIKGTPYPFDEISADGANKPCVGFTKKNLEIHKDLRHPEQYAGMTYKQYEDHARKLLEKKCGPDILGYKTEDGCVCRFNKLTGEYAKGFPGGNILTCFKPTREGQKDKTVIDRQYALDYFLREKVREAYGREKR